MKKWNSPYGELILAPPDIYFIDLRKPMLSSIKYWIKSLKLFIYMSPKSSNVILSEKKQNGTPSNVAKSLAPLFAAVYR